MPDITDKIRLTYLTRTINEQDFIRFFHEEVLQKRGEFTFKHKHIIYYESIQNYNISFIPARRY